MLTYILNSPTGRIKRDIIQKDFQEGGLKMINITCFMTALKVKMDKEVFKSGSKWASILLFSKLDEVLMKCGNWHAMSINCTNKFWNDVVEKEKSYI